MRLAHAVEGEGETELIHDTRQTRETFNSNEFEMISRGEKTLDDSFLPTSDPVPGFDMTSTNPMDTMLDETELDFLWNETQSCPWILPANLFDTDLSLADLSQQYAQNQAAGQSELQDSVVPSADTENPRTSTLDSFDNEGTEKEVPFKYRLELSDNMATCPWKISPTEYTQIANDLNETRHVFPASFSLPTRHTLSRFLEGYFRGFHDHLPFLHPITLSAVALGPELILCLAAIGALHRFEHARGLTSTCPRYAGLPGTPSQNQSSPRETATCNEKQNLRLLQGLMVLTALSSWGDHAVVGDSLAMAGQAAMLVREIGISHPEEIKSTSWEDWIQQEERRRTFFVAYILLNLQSLAFNVPPMILTNEVGMNLPACGAEWRAPNAEQWNRLQNAKILHPRSFQTILHQLLSGEYIHTPNAISAFGNYVLIHGLVQDVFFARNTSSALSESSSLRIDYVKKMESALRAWQESWEATYESTLDPLSPKGPMGFNATALLRMTYIRLNANTGPNRHLITRDPVRIAHGFTDGKIHVCDRSPHLDRAVLQCIHALSVLVHIGVPFIARTQTLNWSIQHSLCNLECAFLLTHWLHMIARCVQDSESGIQILRDDEHKLLNIISSLIREANPDEPLDGGHDASWIRLLAASTDRLWAETFGGFHVFEISHVVGKSLGILAETLDAQAGI